MSENDLEKAVKEISKDLDTLTTLKEKFDVVFNKSKENDKDEEKEFTFQLEMLKVQLGSDVFASIISVIMSIMVAITIVLITLSVGFSDVVASHITLYLIAYPIAVAIVTPIVCWGIFVAFQNKRIKKIQEFIKKKNAETKGK